MNSTRNDMAQYLLQSSKLLTILEAKILENPNNIQKLLKDIENIDVEIRTHLKQFITRDDISKSIIQYIYNFDKIIKQLLSEKNHTKEHLLQFAQMVEKLNQMIKIEIENLKELPKIRILYGSVKQSNYDSFSSEVVSSIENNLGKDTGNNSISIEKDANVHTYRRIAGKFDVEITFCNNFTQIISEGRKRYDYKITDLGYGRGDEIAGLAIIEELNKYKKSGETIILCVDSTNEIISDKIAHLKNEKKIDYILYADKIEIKPTSTIDKIKSFFKQKTLHMISNESQTKLLGKIISDKYVNNLEAIKEII